MAPDDDNDDDDDAYLNTLQREVTQNSLSIRFHTVQPARRKFKKLSIIMRNK
jgi:hypothetical protein